jgi:hypothetical protein
LGRPRFFDPKKFAIAAISTLKTKSIKDIRRVLKSPNDAFSALFSAERCSRITIARSIVDWRFGHIAAANNGSGASEATVLPASLSSHC